MAEIPHMTTSYTFVSPEHILVNQLPEISCFLPVEPVAVQQSIKLKMHCAMQ
jgi:hypothetical protein